MPSPFRVLIVEDFAPDADLMAAELRRAGFDPEWQRVDTESDYLAGLDEVPDVVLADYSLPQFDMLRALRLLQERELDIPFIVVSGTIGEEEAAECVKRGAADYLLKDRMGRLGQAVTGALEQKRLRQERREAARALEESERSARRLAEEQAAIARIGRIISSSLDIGEVYEQFAEEARKLIPFAWTAVTLVDRERGTGVQAYAGGREVRGRGRGEEFPLAGTMSEAVVESRSGLIVDMESLKAVTARFPGLASTFESGVRAIVAAPLISEDRALGVLAFASTEPGVYSQRDVAVAERVAIQIAGAIANARLHADLEREAHEREVLTEIGRAIGSSLDIEQVYERFAEQVRRLLLFDWMSINRVDLVGGTTTVAYTQGKESQGRGRGESWPLEGSFTGMAIRTRGGVRLESERIEETVEQLPAMAGPVKLGVRSALAVPLVASSVVVGLLSISSREEDAYSERDLALAGRVGAQIAGAIANARLYADLEREAHEREVLAEIGRVIGSSLDTEQVYERFADEVRRLVSFDRLTISAPDLEEGTNTNLYVTGVSVNESETGVTVRLPLEEEGRPFDDWLKARVWKPLILDAEETRALAEYWPPEAAAIEAGLVSVVFAPVVWEDSMIAVMTFRSGTEDAYSEDDARLADRVAAQIAGTIVSARLHAALEREARERGERIKELRCMYGVQLAVQSHEKTEDVLREVVALMPEGWRYPEITRARIRFEGEEYVSEAFEETPWTQSAVIRVEGEQRGTVEVFHLEEQPEADEGPFQTEERELIEGIARALSEGAERRVYAAQARARQAEAMTAGRLASIGELAAGVAHEINNPINGIIGYAELIMDRPDTLGEVEQFLSGIIREGERVASIVGNLLTFARDVRQEHSPARVQDILDATLELLRRRVERDGIELKVDIPEDLPEIKCRSQQIQQVFVNLVTNARHALNGKYPQGDPDKVLEISARPVQLEGRAYVRVVFHDHGTGIPESVLPKVFDPFFSTKPEDEGTGLGLSISYGIIKDHEGRIHIDSVDGEFTSVVVDLAVDNGWAVRS